MVELLSGELIVKKVGCHAGEPGCWLRCGLLAYVDETGRLVKVTGNPEHPISRGYVCMERISRMAQFIYHPEQLKHPSNGPAKEASGNGGKFHGNRRLMK